LVFVVPYEIAQSQGRDDETHWAQSYRYSWSLARDARPEDQSDRATLSGRLWRPVRLAPWLRQVASARPL